MIKKNLIGAYSILFLIFAYYYINTVKEVDPFTQITWLFILLIIAIMFSFLRWIIKRRKY
ncbi:Uncharacterised protein [Lederbergia lenta]|uniref:Uncharacterized protein n=1 Tax=Lederbergia lenta TaxID=1467 RepID=A0A2X4WW15_LEDLE|nr:Uncharacterised protein [Lederbergia lenta]